MDIFQEYKEIALQNGFLFESMDDRKTLISPNDRILNSKFCLLSRNDFVYFASDSYAAKVGMSSTYSGVYTTLPIKITDFEADITKRFWFDFLARRSKMNNSFIDKNLTVKTNNIGELSKIVDVKIADNYLKLWKKYPPIKIVIGMDYLSSVSSFKGKHVIGVESNEWIMPSKFIETFSNMQGFVSEMVKRVRYLNVD